MQNTNHFHKTQNFFPIWLGLLPTRSTFGWNKNHIQFSLSRIYFSYAELKTHIKKSEWYSRGHDIRYEVRYLFGWRGCRGRRHGEWWEKLLILKVVGGDEHTKTWKKRKISFHRKSLAKVFFPFILKRKVFFSALFFIL